MNHCVQYRAFSYLYGKGSEKMQDTDYMKRAIELAVKARGWTSPNPMVGAVIVKEGQIIGEGYHERYGQLHAERNALASCTQSPEGAAVYVTLEPCCHYGKTPPCTEALIEAKVSRVVIGSRDPNPKVSGKGAAVLREAGIEVTEDFLRSECDEINPVFFHYITTGQPYVALKYAMTADGKIAAHTGKSQWITGEEARNHVHRLRHCYSGIMAGIGTVLADDPMLNCRLENGRSPVRIVCDSKLRIPENSRLCQTAREIPLIVACVHADPEKKKRLQALGAEVVEVLGKDDRVDINRLMEILGQKGIDSVLVEGGAALNYSVMEAGAVKKCYVYIGAKIFGGETAKSPVGGQGCDSPTTAVQLTSPEVHTFGEDILLEYEVKKGVMPCSPEL